MDRHLQQLHTPPSLALTVDRHLTKGPHKWLCRHSHKVLYVLNKKFKQTVQWIHKIPHKHSKSTELSHFEVFYNQPKKTFTHTATQTQTQTLSHSHNSTINAFKNTRVQTNALVTQCKRMLDIVSQSHSKLSHNHMQTVSPLPSSEWSIYLHMKAVTHSVHYIICTITHTVGALKHETATLSVHASITHNDTIHDGEVSWIHCVNYPMACFMDPDMFHVYYVKCHVWQPV